MRKMHKVIRFEPATDRLIAALTRATVEAEAALDAEPRVLRRDPAVRAATRRALLAIADLSAALRGTAV